jgi:histidine triad (HIT) family protein
VDECLFCRIVNGVIPADVVFRDDQVLAFRDIQPQAPTHILIIPIQHIASTNDLESEHDQIAGRVLRTARQVAQEQGIADSGYRLIVNTGPDAMQSVAHLHVHVLGGRHMGWPPG